MRITPSKIILALTLATAFSIKAQTGYVVLKSFSAQTPSNLGTFTNSDGVVPNAVTLSSRTLYGTTSSGGISGNGLVFFLNTNGTGYTVLKSFSVMTLTTLNSVEALTNSDGASPYAGLTLSGGTLYGTARQGGSFGRGVVFSLNTNGTGYTVLRSFSAVTLNSDGVLTNSDGAHPFAGLTLSGSTLYGTTYGGGISGNGVVFSLNTNGTDYTVLKSLSALKTNSVGIPTNSDGARPEGYLTLSGNTLYGATYFGGSSGQGALFSLKTNGTGYTLIKNFSARTMNSDGIATNSDGSLPGAGLMLSGNTLYGTTTSGGTSGNGVVFSLNTNGIGYTVLKSFSVLIQNSVGIDTNSDGSLPGAGLTLSGSTLYGTTIYGGTSGNGVVFFLNTNGTGYTVLKSFSPTMNNTNGDGANPNAGISLSGSTLYGTTSSGSTFGAGAVFSLSLLPAITNPPQSQLSTLSSNVSFSASVSGVPPFSYQWFLINTNIQTVAGATSQTLNGFVYGAVVTNGGSGYTVAPQVQFIGGGGSGAAGYAVVSNGMVSAINVTNAGSGYISLPAVQIGPPNGLLIGQTNATLNLTAITTNNVGNYFVVISNAYGSVTSSIASLTIAYPPDISQPPQSLNVAQGSNAAFNVNASGTTNLVYQWWMVSGTQSNATAVPVVINGFVLAANVTSGGAGYLAVPNVQIVGGSGSGAGGYAVVSNRLVSAVSITNPGSGYTTPPTIQIAAPSAISLFGQTNATLTLLAVTNGNAANYFMVVTNNFGSVTSAVAALTVFLPPQSFLARSSTNHQVALQLIGSPNYPYILQSATNLTPPVIWKPVLTNPADGNGNWQYMETNFNENQKFYRAVGQ